MASTVKFMCNILKNTLLGSDDKYQKLSDISRMKISEDGESKKVKGTVVLMKRNFFDLHDVKASIVDRVDEILGHKVYLQLISAVQADPTANEYRGKLGKPAYLENWATSITPLSASDATFGVTFEWDLACGIPGAFIIKNFHQKEFYLKTLTLDDVPGHGRVHFICNSWIYPDKYYRRDRIFFSNETYLPHQTPAALCYYREEEMENLRGNGTGMLEKWDRVYDYDVYNDLADPDKGPKYERKILGGSAEYPYPRRGRTGRLPAQTDPKCESRLPLSKSFEIYVPCDERFNQLKMSDFSGFALKLLSQFSHAELDASSFTEFDTFADELKIYDDGRKFPFESLVRMIRDIVPWELLKELLRSDGEHLRKFPMPHVIKEDKSAWRTDEEFAREMLAGLNPLVICCLKEFPPTSKLDHKVFGNQNSSITEDHLVNKIDGLTIEQAIKENRLFLLNYHDTLMPYLRCINTTTTKTYATRTFLFLQGDGTLKPLAIELSLPHPEGDHLGAVSKVYTPSQDGHEATVWQLAKAYVAVNDSGYHQLISHWLNTHAVVEPFVIATTRQLSVMHPIYKLLHPHFRDTMFINAFARQTLINACGIVEMTVFPSKYAMEMSAVIYKNWVFPDQALPTDLIKRGMAVEDASAPHGLRLLIQDYPFAVDGLEIWSAIKSWVEEYCHFYYESDNVIQGDSELQAWWKELREVGHGDKKDEPWWPKMQSVQELIDSCTILIWLASALHAAVNFGQYPYAGYLPNRPTLSRRFMPEPGTPEFDELKTNPDKAFLRTVTPQMQTLLGVSLIEMLSRHTSDEVYLGQRDTPEWTKDLEPLQAFERFGKRLREIEDKITQMNCDEKLKNRSGPVKMPYISLYPSSEMGLTGKGISNSISI
ncbi:putative linoleate 9S-lipoxygenase 5 [Capsicum annuum]|uniref:probable linoleate 9S-lipoxygenase 5 isoform X1 n=1 Tax=Capsicum annuum TaxID=4072 RepID=UPI001FB115ED|nr:probable linoleate 9S-lipoxygenase 5 isoform X1 [Capsicum annuum]KAF3653017.1 putative linoleate 9S-lipoxygenase 5 [Capsicum annuum]